MGQSERLTSIVIYRFHHLVCADVHHGSETGNTLNQALSPRGASGSTEKEPLPEEGEAEPCAHHMRVGGI